MSIKSFVRAAAVLAFGIGIALPVQAQVTVDARIPEYKPVGGVSGNMKSIGSDTMNIVMESWCQDFKKIYPNVQYEIEGKGSATFG